MTFVIRPEVVVMTPYVESSSHEAMSGEIRVYYKFGNETLVYLDVLGLANEIVSRSGPRFEVAIEDKVTFNFRMEFIQVFDYDTGESLLKK